MANWDLPKRKYWVCVNRKKSSVTLSGISCCSWNLSVTGTMQAQSTYTE